MNKQIKNLSSFAKQNNISQTEHQILVEKDFLKFAEHHQVMFTDDYYCFDIHCLHCILGGSLGPGCVNTDHFDILFLKEKYPEHNI